MCDAKGCKAVGIHMVFISGDDNIQLCTNHKKYYDNIMSERLYAIEVEI